MKESRQVLAIDLGGTKALAGVVAAGGEVRSRVLVTSRELQGQPEHLMDRIAEAGRLAAHEAGMSLTDLAAIGMGVPGPLDAARSVVSVAPNLGWVQFPAREKLAARLPGLPVFLENDVRAVARSEHTLGAGRGYGSMIAIFVGSGVGGGLIVGGRVYHGEHGGAGEVGHMVVQAGGPHCPCGSRGCLEAVAARGGVARHVAQQVARGKATVLTELLKGNLSALTSRDLANAIAQNDAVAIAAARRSARYVGLAIGGLVNLQDPGIVVLGGGIVEALGAPYVAWASDSARKQILAPAAKAVPIVPASLGDDAGLLGAALTAFAGLDAEPATGP